jgi:mitochondrial ATPase complex subunit ATP10
MRTVQFLSEQVKLAILVKKMSGQKMMMTSLMKKRPAVARQLLPASRAFHASSSVFDIQLSRRDRLIKERGYFHEMVELNRTGGKLFIASNELLKPSSAETFPPLTADSISEGEMIMPSAAVGKISIVGISFKQYGFEQLVSWMEPLQNKYNLIQTQNNKKSTSKQNVQLMYCSMTEGGLLASLLRGSMKSGLSKTIPKELHSTSMVYVGDLDKICETLNIDNRLVGHLFLLDSKAKVRWHGCGDATPDELESLVKMVDELQQ